MTTPEREIRALSRQRHLPDGELFLEMLLMARTLAGLFCFTVALGWSAAASAAAIVINNGLAPPNPANVISDAAYQYDGFIIRNVGCPPGWPASGDPWDPCPSPGAATEVELADGGEVGGLDPHDSSTVTISGGRVNMAMFASDSSTITMTGGTVWGVVDLAHSSSFTITGGILQAETFLAYDSATITMTGGTVYYGFTAEEHSTVTIVGNNFEVDGVPVLYGDLSASSGILTGELLSGDPLDIHFGRYDDAIITLIPEPSTALLVGLGLVGLATWRRRAV
jgi:hypothetical protein